MDEDRVKGDIDFDFFDDDGVGGEKVQSNSKSLTASGYGSKDRARRSRSPTPESDRSKSRSSDQHGYSDDSFDSDSDKDSDSKRPKTKKSSGSDSSDDSRTSTPRNGILKSRAKSGSKHTSSSSENSDDDDDRTISSRSSAEEESRTVSFSTTTVDSRSISKKDRPDEGRRKHVWGEDRAPSRRGRGREDRNNAWVEKKPPRPSTAKASDRKNRERDREHVKIVEQPRSRSLSGSDSEMTDVSPLPSPRDSPQQRRKHTSGQDSDRSSGSRSRRMPQYREMPLEGYFTHGDTLDLELLKNAVLDLEKQKRLRENRRVMFEPPSGKSDRNFTFSKDRAMFIERENQRLLGEILRTSPGKQQQKKKAVPTAASPVYRMTHSAVNRQRQQQQIEMENLAFLRRLQKVKPTKGMSRNEQIKDFSGTMLYGAPYGALHEMESRKVRSSAPTPAPQENLLRSGHRTRSMTSLHSAASSTSSRRSRRSSRSSREMADTRPPWNDRW